MRNAPAPTLPLRVRLFARMPLAGDAIPSSVPLCAPSDWRAVAPTLPREACAQRGSGRRRPLKGRHSQALCLLPSSGSIGGRMPKQATWMYLCVSRRKGASRGRIEATLAEASHMDHSRPCRSSRKQRANRHPASDTPGKGGGGMAQSSSPHVAPSGLMQYAG